MLEDFKAFVLRRHRHLRGGGAAPDAVSILSA